MFILLREKRSLALNCFAKYAERIHGCTLKAQREKAQITDY